MSLYEDGFRLSVATLVEIHNDLVKEIENINQNENSYSVYKMRLCLSSNVVVIRDTLEKLDNMIKTNNESEG